MNDAASQVLFNGELFADYFQFYLRDDGEASLPDDYTEEALRRRVTSGPHALLIHTARNMTVPVRVELHASRPSIDATTIQHAVQAGFSAPSGWRSWPG